MPSLTTNIQQQLQETLSEVYITEIQNQTTTAKSKELENWKKRNVYVEEGDISQLLFLSDGC